MEKAGPVPEGLSRGVAIFESFGSYVAEVLDIEVIDGVVYPRRLVAAVDCGLVVHPETVKMQVMRREVGRTRGTGASARRTAQLVVMGDSDRGVSGGRRRGRW